MAMHSSSNAKLSCPQNAERAFNQAGECTDFGTTLPRQFCNQHAASKLTGTQDRALFSGEVLVWLGAVDGVPCSKFLDCKTASRSAGLS